MKTQIYKFRLVEKRNASWLLDEFGERYYFHFVEGRWQLDGIAGIADGCLVLQGETKAEIVKTLNGLGFISIKRF